VAVEHKVPETLFQMSSLHATTGWQNVGVIACTDPPEGSLTVTERLVGKRLTILLQLQTFLVSPGLHHVSLFPSTPACTHLKKQTSLGLILFIGVRGSCGSNLKGTAWTDAMPSEYSFDGPLVERYVEGIERVTLFLAN
jgi:hypothetical protein